MAATVDRRDCSTSPTKTGIRSHTRATGAGSPGRPAGARPSSLRRCDSLDALEQRLATYAFGLHHTRFFELHLLIGLQRWCTSG